MIPSVVSEQVRQGVADFLRTTFPITTPFFAGALDRLLDAPDAIFKGPYLSIKLPFLPADGGEGYFPGLLPDGLRPYRHQEEAWRRLRRETGASTIIATGTGSGKTECFLYPILDYCRARREESGIKAILIYPMNALATDQARRLARMIHGNPDLNGQVTAGLFIGERPKVATGAMTESEVITDKDAMRETPPDILLTNYKMLDYLLVRPREHRLWQGNGPETLRYLVVDELHTFDGAQAADLACLIRRIKERLKTPTGHLCCVGTSATLGTDDAGATPEDLRTFARQVFAEPFDAGSIVGESLMGVGEFLGGRAATRFSVPGPEQAGEMDPLGYPSVEVYLGAQCRLWLGDDPQAGGGQGWAVRLGEALMDHSFFRMLLDVLGNRALPPSSILEQLAGRFPDNQGSDRVYLERVMASFLALVSTARAIQGGRVVPLVQVRHQLWLRELRRMVAPVERSPLLRFADDLKEEERQRSLPVIHCRECGLTGWAGTKLDAATRVVADLPTFYNAFFEFSPHVVFLFPEVRDGEVQQEIPTFLCGECLEVQSGAELGKCRQCGASAGQLIPVWKPKTTRTVQGKNGQDYIVGEHNCPSCGGRQSLTILGSRAASLLSVIIAQLYSTPYNEDKKLLAFSDSVQDASHRAGFFSARTYTFSLRAAIQRVVMEAGGVVPLADLTSRFLEYWRAQMTEPESVAAFLPPDMGWLEDYASLRREGALPEGSDLVAGLEKRLDWEIWSEYTFDCRIGRTLEKTGASTIEMVPERLAGLLEAALKPLREKTGLANLNRDALGRFIAGLVQGIKSRGGVFQQELGQYLDSLGNTWLLGKRKGRDHVHRPYFSRHSRAPVFLATRAKERLQTFVRSGRSTTPTWYEDWIAKALQEADPAVSGYADVVYTMLVEVLLAQKVFFERESQGVKIWGLLPEVFRTTTAVSQLRCGTCAYAVSAGAAEAALLAGGPCLRYGCAGEMAIRPGSDDYYRKLYESGDMTRIFPEEHTGLLTRERREEIEEGFRERRLPGDPNLLSCTPTLEMGINIGDLSSLALCSVPPKPSNYLQRVGRAGRVNGNSFLFTVANARPHDLFFFLQPQEMIEGRVEPPGCFLNASAVLERQLTAFVFDRWVDSGAQEADLPSKMRPVLDAIDADKITEGFPANVLGFFEKSRTELEERFIALFDGEIADYTRERIRVFCRGSEEEAPGLQAGLWEGLRSVAKERKGFKARIDALQRKIKEMEKNPAQDEPTRDAVREMKMERSAIIEIVKGFNERHILNFLTDEGLLPNYAFPEAGVQLQSVIYRFNPKAENDEKKYRTDIYKYERPAAAAIAELAPENSFYAEGRKLEIDQVSLQHSKIEIWRFCDACSHMALDENLGDQEKCPRCGSAMWVDEGQRRKILRIRQVISTMREDESRSYDESDDREPRFYQRNMFVGKRDEDITAAFFIDQEEVPFGFEFFRKVTLREVNLGEKKVSGAKVHIAGREFFDRPFEICKGCGKVKKGDELKHAVSCRYWKKETQEKTHEGCYLYREFSSEAIRMLLPVASLDVDRNIHSFVAALDLGLRRQFRGDPGHLMTTLMEEPVAGTDVRKRYLVLYDGVPGGTGYLKELMRDRDVLLEVFKKAFDVLRDCACQNDPEKDGCYRCLLAYRGRHDHQSTSRQAAMRLLGMILDNREHLKQTERLDSIKLNKLLESELEGRFVEALRRAIKESGGEFKPTVTNGKKGWYARTAQGAWMIEPQVELGPGQGVEITSRADFLIRPERPLEGELPIAVFADGYEYHADPDGKMRVGQDTAQRLAIARSGRYRYWLVNWDDVQEHLGAKPQEFVPNLFPGGAKLAGVLRALDPENGHQWAVVEKASSMGALLLLLGAGRTWDWGRYASAYIASLLEKVPCTRPEALELREALLKTEPQGVWPETWAGTVNAESPWIVGRLRFTSPDGVPLVRGLAAMETAALTSRSLHPHFALFRLEDGNAALAEEKWKRAWREFLRLMNLLQFSGTADFVTGVGLKDQAYGSLIDESRLSRVKETVPEKVAALLELVDATLRPLIHAVAAAKLPLPELGFEVADEAGGIVASAELAWPGKKVAVVLPEDAVSTPGLKKAGWRVYRADEVSANPEPLLVALRSEENS